MDRGKEPLYWWDGGGGFGMLNQAGLETNKETHVMIL